MTASDWTTAVLVAAGRSERMALPGPNGERLRKPFLRVAGATVLEHTLRAFDAVPAVREIVIVAHREDQERVQALGRSAACFGKVRAVVVGGEQRSDSVRAGVQAAATSCTWVAIHDAARALIEPACIAQAIALAARAGAALVAVPIRDTVKRSERGTHAEETLDRSKLWSAQTPQVFERQRFLELLERAAVEQLSPTDDAALWERYVGPVPFSAGSPSNIKLTTPEDLVLAEALLRARHP